LHTYLYTFSDFRKKIISQDSVATHIRCDEIFYYHLISNFSQSVTVKFFLIGQYLAKILTNISWHVFMAHGVYSVGRLQSLWINGFLFVGKCFWRRWDAQQTPPEHWEIIVHACRSQFYPMANG